jgi:type IV pilus assembly protein PilF
MMMRLHACIGGLAKCFLFFGVAMVLAGCASSTPPAASSKTPDWVTESDEPEARKRARRHLTLAVMYFKDNKTTVALDSVKQAIAADPRWAQAHDLRGLILSRLNDLALAEESFKRALDLEPNNASIQHNYAYTVLCRQTKTREAIALFQRALANPTYTEKARTWMAKGECELQAGLRDDAEASFLKSFQLDAANPFTAYNIANLKYQRNDLQSAQFYIRRLNSSDAANAESLWLAIKIERKLGNRDAVEQLATQLAKRYPQSREFFAFERGAFDE